MPGAGAVFVSLSFSPPVSLVMVSKPAGQVSMSHTWACLITCSVYSTGFTVSQFDSYVLILRNHNRILHRWSTSLPPFCFDHIGTPGSCPVQSVSGDGQTVFLSETRLWQSYNFLALEGLGFPSRKHAGLKSQYVWSWCYLLLTHALFNGKFLEKIICFHWGNSSPNCKSQISPRQNNIYNQAYFLTWILFTPA